MATTVGMREFRASLADYIDSDEPVAITRHGQTVGYFIPTRTDLHAEVAALRTAAAALDELLAEKGIDPDQLLDEFKTARQSGR